MYGEVKKKLGKYNYPDKVQEYVIPCAVDMAAAAKAPQNAEKILAQFAQHTCKLIRKQEITPRFAADAFNMLFLFLEEIEPAINLGPEAQELLFEGQMLSDLGESYAPTLKEIEDEV